MGDTRPLGDSEGLEITRDAPPENRIHGKVTVSIKVMGSKLTRTPSPVLSLRGEKSACRLEGVDKLLLNTGNRLLEERRR